MKAALIKGTTASLNDFTEVILKVCKSRGKQGGKTDWMQGNFCEKGEVWGSL